MDVTALIRPGERLDDLQRGGLRILQRPDGFRFGTDAVLLADFARVGAGEDAADFGTGTGILPLLLLGRGKGRHYDAFELQEDMADMAQRTMRLNGLEDRVSVHALPVERADEVVRPGSLGSIVCNPPYGERMLEQRSAQRLYGAFGRHLKYADGWKKYIISSEPEFEHYFGRQAVKKRKLYNGRLQCNVYMYY